MRTYYIRGNLFLITRKASTSTPKMTTETMIEAKKVETVRFSSCCTLWVFCELFDRPDAMLGSRVKSR